MLKYDLNGIFDPAGAPYDLLLAAAVLEHLRQPERVLCEARPLLRPNARVIVIVSLPNIAHWRSRLRLLLGRFEYQDYGIMDRTHSRFYTLSTGRALLESNGYRVERLHIAGSGLQNALNAAARRLGRPASRPILPGLLAYELIYEACSLPVAGDTA
ncbi:MAG: methyltransferase domain-containing protein [Aggregatilineales bacterium]